MGQDVLRGVALSLGLDADYFAAGYTAIADRAVPDLPLPARAGRTTPGWGVGEHTDYGLLTLLAQDDNGGLQVHTPDGWIDAPPLPDTFVCNIGDMLERLTGGWYRSTPHRVRNTSGRDRLSFPFFFDPDFAAEVPPLPDRAATDAGGRRRWDGASLHAFEGTYGDYLTARWRRSSRTCTTKWASEPAGPRSPAASGPPESTLPTGTDEARVTG